MNNRLGRNNYIILILLLVGLGNVLFYFFDYVIVSVILYLIFLCISKLRINDCNFSYHYILMLVIPVVNILFLLPLLCTSSYPYSNKYGHVKRNISEKKLYKIE